MPLMVKWHWRGASVVFVVVTAFLVRERAHAQQKVSNDFLVTHVVCLTACEWRIRRSLE